MDEANNTERHGRSPLASALSWTLVDTWVGQAIQLLLFVVLARLLTPADFGVVAFAAVLVTFGRLIVGQGLTDPLVQRPVLTQAHLDAAFWLAMIVALSVAALGMVLADPLAQLIRLPRLAPVLQVLMLTVPLAPLSAIQMALLRRALDLRRVAIRTIISLSAGGVVAVALALAGAGIWALVAQQIAFSAVSATVLWATTPWRPTLRLPRRELAEIMPHSGNMVAADLLTWGGRNVDNVIVGAWLGPTALGLYSAGYRLLDVGHILLASIPRRVLFPALTRMQHDAGQLAADYLAHVRMATSLALPAYVGLAVLAPPTATLVLGPRWSESGLVAGVLLLGGPALFLAELAYALLQAVGLTKRVRQARMVWLLSLAAGVFVAAEHGIVWVAAAVALAGYIVLPVLMLSVQRQLRVGTQALARATAPGMVMALLTGMIMAAPQAILAVIAWPALLATAFAGVGLWVGLLWVLDRPTLRSIIAGSRALR